MASGVHVETTNAEPSGARPELRALALAALALALFAVVGLASSVSAWHATRAASAPTTALQGLAAAGGVVLVVALLLLWVETPTAPRLKRKRRTLAGDEFDELGPSLWAAGMALAVGLLALAIFCIAALPLLSGASAPSQSLIGAHPSARAGPSRSQGGVGPFREPGLASASDRRHLHDPDSCRRSDSSTAVEAGPSGAGRRAKRARAGGASVDRGA